MESPSLAPSCERCGSAVVLVPPSVRSLSKDSFEELPPGVWRYRALLPSSAPEDVVTLGEGGTPLLRAERLGPELGLNNLLIKDESRNPTGSFVDRGSTLLMSIAKRLGVRECTCVTTGNLGASLSAYCAKADIRAHIRVHPDADQGKLYQMLAYGAEIEGRGSHYIEHAHDRHSLAVTAANPYLLEGEKTTGFELVQDLGWKTPDAIVVPVGTGGHLRMIWQAITQLREAGLVPESGCRLIGVQVEGAPGSGRSRPTIDSPARNRPLAELEESEPLFRKEATRAMAESGGMALVTTSADTVNAIGALARTEGIFAEPASASVIAALAEGIGRGHIGRNENVVCIITGAGLKDPRAVSRLAREARRSRASEGYTLPVSQIGTTKVALLRMLGKGPNYGYGLWRQLHSEGGLTTASVYQHLSELEGFDMVRRRGSLSAKGRVRVVYELTRRGADFLRIADRLEQV
jgi:threonine synthase